MIVDFNFDRKNLSIDVVGAKYFNLYLVKNDLKLPVPEALCLTDYHYDRNELAKRINTGMKYAIRSSSNQEDRSDGSAAGMFHSYLNIQGLENIEIAIEKCFKSTKNKEVIEYLKKMGNNTLDLRISVIVQQMVQPDFAGVIFTSNPVNGAEEYVIESTEGIAETILEGTQSPEMTIIEKDTKPANEMHSQLIETAKKIAEYFDEPQDIEWAFADNKVYVLQTRPISSLGNFADPSQIWTRANIGEILPKPLTPLSWDIFEKVIFNSYRFGYYSIPDRILMNLVHLIPREWPKVKSPRLFEGYAYLNLDTILVTFSFEPWVDAEILKIGLGFDLSDINVHKRRKLTTRIILYLKITQFFLEIFIPKISFEERSVNFVRKRLQNLQNSENLDQLLKNASFVFGWHIAATARSFASLGFMKRKLKETFSPFLIAKSLSEGKSQNFFKAVARIKHLISTNQDLLKKIEKCDLAEYRSWSKFDAFVEQFSNFLEKFGHKSENEFELSQESWKDNPSLLKSMLIDENLMVDYPKNEPAEKKSAGKGINISFQIREELKDILIGEYHKIRSFVLDMGQALAKKSVIDDPGDIFYLRLEEIEKRDFDDLIGLKKKIENRKKSYKDMCKKSMPYSFVGSDLMMSEDIHKENNENVIKGLGCSGGTMKGRAVHVFNLAEGSVFKKGDILVTYATNPGWTPLFALAGGVVTEIGGMLSHTATIAREYRIPMVTNVHNIKSQIKNGDLIEIDGSLGIIRNLETNH